MTDKVEFEDIGTATTKVAGSNSREAITQIAGWISENSNGFPNPNSLGNIEPAVTFRFLLNDCTDMKSPIYTASQSDIERFRAIFSGSEERIECP